MMCFSSLFLFTTVMIVTFWVKDAVPDALIVMFGGAVFGETTGCAIIKALNIKKEGDT